MDNERATPKVPVQFRIGKALLERVDDAVLYSDHNSRNLWMVEAIENQLEDGEPTPYLVTATMLLQDKETIMVRLPVLTLELVDEECDEREMDRTVWLLDAMLSQLAKNGFGSE